MAKDRWDPNDALSGEEKRRKEREIANVMKDVVRDRYNPTMTGTSLYREEPRRGEGIPTIRGVDARLVEAEQERQKREHEGVLWNAYREAQGLEFDRARARAPRLQWSEWVKTWPGFEEWKARKEGKS